MEFGVRDIYDDEDRLEQADTQDMGGEAGDTPGAAKRARKTSKKAYARRTAKKAPSTTDVDSNIY